MNRRTAVLSAGLIGAGLLAAISMQFDVASLLDRAMSPPLEMPTVALRSAREASSTLHVARGVEIRADVTEMRAALDSAYRLQIDQRFSAALADIDSVLGAAPVSWSTRFEKGRWSISADGASVGTLPEFPDFDDALLLATDRAKRQLATHPIKMTPSTADRSTLLSRIADAWATAPIEALEEADALWEGGDHDPQLLRAIVHGASRLSFQARDTMQVADELPARALALVAIEKALLGANESDDLIELSWAMGYGAAARRSATTLAKNDPLRLYVEDDSVRLRSLATAPRADARARMLWLGLAARSDLTLPEQKQAEPLPLLLARTDSQSFGVASAAAEDLLQLVAIDLATNLEGDFARGQATAKTAFSQRRIAAWFDANVEEAGKRTRTHFTTGLRRAWYRGSFYAAVQQIATHYAVSKSSSDEAREFAKALGAGESPYGSASVAWIELLASVHEGNKARAPVLAALQAPSILGALPWTLVAFPLANERDADGIAVRGAVTMLAHRMDSRPALRQWLLWFAGQGLDDLVLKERLQKATIDASPQMLGIRIDQAYEAGDTGKLDAIARGTGAATQRLHAVSSLTYLDPPEKQIVMRYRDLLAEAPNSFAIHESFAEWYERREKFAEAITLWNAWLAKVSKTPSLASGLEVPIAQTRMAMDLCSQGNFAAGRRYGDAALESGMNRAMHAAAFCHAGAGDKAGAERIGKESVERYPTSSSMAWLARIYWMTGQDEKAAEALASTQIALDWCEDVAVEFERAFHKRSDDDIRAAVRALREKKIQAARIEELARVLGWKRGHELEESILALLPPSTSRLARSVRVIAQTRGEAAAEAFIHGKMPADPPGKIVTYANVEALPAIGWEAPDPVGETEQDDLIWFLRTTAGMRDPAMQDTREHMAVLLVHYANAAPRRYHTMGRYVLGLEKADALMPYALTGDRAEVPYVYGLRARYEGRLADAITWSRAALEAGEDHSLQAYFARQDLRTWSGERKSIARIAAAERATRTHAPTAATR